MIYSLEEFRDACKATPNARLAVGTDGGEYFFDATCGSAELQVDPGLIKRMTNLGILYYYGGILEVNPMAIRIMDRMAVEGRILEESAFRREIEESRNQHQIDHFDDHAEMENV